MLRAGTRRSLGEDRLVAEQHVANERERNALGRHLGARDATTSRLTWVVCNGGCEAQTSIVMPGSISTLGLMAA